MRNAPALASRKKNRHSCMNQTGYLMEKKKLNNDLISSRDGQLFIGRQPNDPKGTVSFIYK